jgi:LPXTG-motif cell wall-anchored protein
MLVLGVVLISPLGDFLPVESVGSLASLAGQSTRPGHFRVVPAAGNAEGTGALLFLIGLLLAGAGWILKRRSQRPL